MLEDKPVISCTTGTENKVIRTEKVSISSSLNSVNHTRFQIDKNRTRNITTSISFCEVNGNALEFVGALTNVLTGSVDRVFTTQSLPETGTNLVTTLPSLNADNFPHVCLLSVACRPLPSHDKLQKRPTRRDKNVWTQDQFGAEMIRKTNSYE